MNKNWITKQAHPLVLKYTVDTRFIDRQIDRQIGRQTDRQLNRQTE